LLCALRSKGDNMAVIPPIKGRQLGGIGGNTAQPKKKSPDLPFGRKTEASHGSFREPNTSPLNRAFR